MKLRRTKNVQFINLSAINVREKSEGKFNVLSVIIPDMKLFENVKNDKCSSSIVSVHLVSVLVSA